MWEYEIKAMLWFKKVQGGFLLVDNILVVMATSFDIS